jgi:hypothetical protein
MYSSNDKLIDEIRKRLLTQRKNNPLHFIQNGLETRRISTLMPRKGSESKRNTIRRQTNLNYLSEDKINLRLIPVIKSEKAIMIIKKDDNTIFNTENNDINFTRNKIHFKKQKINSNSNLYIKTFSNIISSSNSLGKIKIFSKKKLFLSPFQYNNNKNKYFKNLVNFSKEIHSPKHKEKSLINNNFNIKSFNKINEKQIRKRNQKTIFTPKFTLKKFKIKNELLNENKNENKNEKNYENDDKTKVKFLIKGLNKEKEIIKNKMENKKKKIKPNCYYNKLHLNKINDIIEKYSYNNID